MWWIELFDAKREFVGRLITPRPLRVYHDSVQAVLREPGEVENGAELDRSETLSNAELIVYAERVRRGENDPETMTKLSRLVLAEVLSDRKILDEFLDRTAHDQVIQLGVPRTPEDASEIQWRRTTQEERDLFLAELDPATLADYRRQILESAELRKR